MRAYQTPLPVFLLVWLISFPRSETLAQSFNLPPELGQDSSLSEIMNWLDKNSFAKAWIGLNGGGESAIFNQGFRLFKLERCVLTLRNDNIKVLRFSTNAYPHEFQSLERFRTKTNELTPYPAELQIRLNRISYDRHKAPRLHTTDPAKAKLFGSWRTKFRQKRGRSRPQDVLLIHIIHPPSPEERPGYSYGRDEMYAGTITFTFDQREASEHFYAAFHQAVELCANKK